MSTCARAREVAVIAGAQALSGAIGNMLGGLASDVLARRFGLHGRPLSAQLTVAMGIPIVYFIFVGIPPGTGADHTAGWAGGSSQDLSRQMTGGNWANWAMTAWSC